MMRSRKGDWIQIFLILFFVFIVILALALLTIQGQSEEETSTQAVVSYGDAQAHVALIGLLNQPYPIDLDGDGNIDTGTTIADALAKNDKALDAQLQVALRSRLPDDALWIYEVDRPGGGMSGYIVDAKDYPGGLASFSSKAPKATIILPGKITVTLLLTDSGPTTYDALVEARS